MWKPLLIEILASDQNPSLSQDIQLGGEVQICEFETGDCSLQQSSGSIDSSSLNASALSSCGLIIEVEAGESITAGDIVSLTTNGWQISEVTPDPKPAHGLAVSSANEGNTFTVLLYGSFKDSNLNITNTAVALYLTNSGFSPNPPSFKQLIGSKLSNSNTVFFNPDWMYLLEIA